ncbi:MAG: hypothetical protein L0Y71_16145 [Gemmataceae bacterium]|nr:hypothetical protein [Gemmataceae bacterium]
MPQCPQCSKPLRDLVRRCPTCQADLDLLVDYVSHLNGGLERAENLTRAGELGQAFWAYMEVLEVDPDNSPAKRQVSQVITAVRQFDQMNQGRRWLAEVRHGPPSKSPFAALPPWAWAAIAAGLVVAAFALGYAAGFYAPTETPSDDRQELNRPDNQMGLPPPKMKELPPPEPD